LALATLPGAPNTPVLAVGGDDCAVQLYVADRIGDPFKLAVALRGHDDWVRAVSFATFDDGTLVLASGAQDMFIRLWVISHASETPHDEPLLSVKSEAAPSAADGLDGGVHPPVVSEFRRKALKEFDVEFEAGANAFSARFDSLLMGHDNWVYVQLFSFFFFLCLRLPSSSSSILSS
jgi:elongator complex protein 2